MYGTVLVYYGTVCWVIFGMVLCIDESRLICIGQTGTQSHSYHLKIIRSFIEPASSSTLIDKLQKDAQRELNVMRYK